MPWSGPDVRFWFGGSSVESGNNAKKLNLEENKREKVTACS